MPTCLIIEPDDSTRRGLAKLFELHGFHAVAVSGAGSALRALGPAIPDLIVLEPSLPPLVAPSMPWRSLAVAGLAGVPVVAYAADDGPDARRQAREAGVVAFVAKGVGWEELITVVEQHLPRPTRLRLATS